MTTKTPELTDKERLFVAGYLIDLNAGQAALRAGFGGGSVGAARVAGHRLRRKPHVADAIAKALGERMGVTRAKILEEVSRLAFSNIGDVLTVEDGKLVVKITPPSIVIRYPRSPASARVLTRKSAEASRCGSTIGSRPSPCLRALRAC